LNNSFIPNRRSAVITLNGQVDDGPEPIDSLAESGTRNPSPTEKGSDRETKGAADWTAGLLFPSQWRQGGSLERRAVFALFGDREQSPVLAAGNGFC
jgi:hypothetical protein